MANRWNFPTACDGTEERLSIVFALGSLLSSVPAKHLNLQLSRQTGICRCSLHKWIIQTAQSARQLSCTTQTDDFEKEISWICHLWTHERRLVFFQIRLQRLFLSEGTLMDHYEAFRFVDLNTDIHIDFSHSYFSCNLSPLAANGYT